MKVKGGGHYSSAVSDGARTKISIFINIFSSYHIMVQNWRKDRKNYHHVCIGVSRGQGGEPSSSDILCTALSSNTNSVT